MENLILISFAASIFGVAFPEKSYNPRQIYPPAFLVGFLVWFWVGGVVGYHLGILAAVIRLLVCLPFRLCLLNSAEVGSGYFWRMWAFEQLTQGAFLITIFSLID